VPAVVQPGPPGIEPPVAEPEPAETPGAAQEVAPVVAPDRPALEE